MAWYKPKDVIKKTRKYVSGALDSAKDYVSDALDSAKDHGVDIRRVARAFATGGLSEIGKGLRHYADKLVPDYSDLGGDIQIKYPSSDDSSVDAAKQAEINRRKKALGRAAMILTTGKTLGQANVRKQTLLGA